MRLIIVSDDVPEVPGVVVGPSSSTRSKAVATALATELFNKKRSLGREAFRIFVRSLSSAGADALLDETELVRLKRELPMALERAYELGLSDAPRPDGLELTVAGLALVDPAALTLPRLAWESRCLTVLPKGVGPVVEVPPHTAKIFQGAFSREQQLDAVLGSNGGNARVHIFQRATAKQVFRRLGNGVLEQGVYLLHPKREGTLVPFATYHTDLLQEMTRELRVVMGCLGAKRVEVETIEGVSFTGAVVSRLPAKKGSVEAEARSSEERRQLYEWASSTFEPEDALKDCVWIFDNAQAMTIVDQRRRSDLVRFEEYSKLDTSFGVSVDLMSAFKTGFTWCAESTYRYAIEFFPRSR